MVALVLMFGLLSGNRKPGGAAQPVAQFSLKVHTVPSGATIRVNKEARGVSDLQLNLPAGTYEIEAELDGYQPKSQTFEAKAGAANAIELTLDPALPLLKVSSDTVGEKSPLMISRREILKVRSGRSTRFPLATTHSSLMGSRAAPHSASPARQARRRWSKDQSPLKGCWWW